MARRAIEAGDFEKLLMLPVFTLIAWSVPERFWFPICRLVARTTGFLLRSRREAWIARVPLYIVSLAREPDDQVSVDVVAGWHREMLEVLRCHRPGGWQPAIVLYGEPHLKKALSLGHGAVLWVGQFESAELIAKMALARHGYRTCHLTRPDHGFSPSPFGIRFLNPIRISVEDRFLDSRIMMRDAGETARSLRELRRSLAEGKLVSITVLDRASKTKSVRFFDSERLLPTGPITLARAANAPLMPVFTLRRSPRQFDVIVEPPIEVPDTRDYDTPLEQYARLLEGYVRRAPLLTEDGSLTPQRK